MKRIKLIPMLLLIFITGCPAQPLVSTVEESQPETIESPTLANPQPFSRSSVDPSPHLSSGIQPTTAVSEAVLTASDPNSQINLRATPSVTGKYLGYGLVNDRVKVINKIISADGNTWYEVKFPRSGAQGWIHGDFVELIGTSEPSLAATTESFISIGRAAKLNPVQIKQAISLDKNNSRGMEFKIAVPTYVPTGFELESFGATEDGYGPLYWIVYRNSSNLCFEISANSGGWGAVPQDYETVEVVSPAFGKVVLEYTDFDQIRNKAYIRFKDAPIVRGEPGKKRGYFFASPVESFEAKKSSENLAICDRINISEALKVVESIQYINP